MSIDNELRRDKHYVYPHHLIVFYKKRWIIIPFAIIKFLKHTDSCRKLAWRLRGISSYSLNSCIFITNVSALNV